MPLVRIEQLEDARLDDYRNVSDAELLRRRGLFVGEGRLVSRRLLRSPHRVVSVLVNEASFKSLEDDLAGIIDEIPVYVCSTPELAGIVGFNLHRGCLALAERPSDREPDGILAGARRLLVLEAVTDADNVGSAFRNAAAFGIDGVLLSACCDPLYRKAVRTSMASVLEMPYAGLKDWPRDVARLQAGGFTVVALTPAEHAMDISNFVRRRPRPEKVALLVGSELSGLAPETLSMANVCVRIPMRPGFDSLNLATATGIAMYALVSVIP
jgi:tRNA G18 (ribose-2'-O)-methylase SpoU